MGNIKHMFKLANLALGALLATTSSAMETAASTSQTQFDEDQVVGPVLIEWTTTINSRNDVDDTIKVMDKNVAFHQNDDSVLINTWGFIASNKIKQVQLFQNFEAL